MPQTGHGLPKRPWTAISGRNAVHSLRKCAACLRAQTRDPFAEHGASRGEEPRDLGIAEFAGERDRRQAGAMQDLVRVGVADAGKEARIGQRSLERVILGRRRAANARAQCP
jgi:hypothetical protein